MSTFNTLIRKASSILRINSQDSSQKCAVDGETIFCKNNVCVHPPTSVRTEMVHHPGYLTIREQNDEVLGSTLILSWIPNATLKKNHRSLENRTPCSSPCRSSHSSTCPSPIINSRSPLHLPHFGCDSPYACSERSIDDFGQMGSKFHYSDRRSISSTISDMGSPREGFGSLESFSASDQTEMTASTSSQPLSVEISDIEQNEMFNVLPITTQSDENCTASSKTGNNINMRSQSDSGIGPEEVIAALEIMISGLNDIDVSNQGNSCVDSSGVGTKKLSSGSGIDELSQKIQCSPNCLEEKCSYVQGNPIKPQLINNSMDAVTKEISVNSPVKEMKSLTSLTLSSLTENVCSKVDGDDANNTACLSPLYEESSFTSVCELRDFQTKHYCESEKKSNLKLYLSQNLNNDVNEEDTVVSSTPDINVSSCISTSSSTTATTSNKDPESFSSTPAETPPVSPLHQLKSNFLYVEGTPESVAHAHNLIFPDSMQSPNKLTKRESACGVFSVDLSQMRSLRLFFSNKECTCGQLVIASRESQYKILHFHYGGLDRLAKVFEDYNFLSKSKGKLAENCPYRQFSVCRPELTAAECHPEEEIYSTVDEVRWREFMNEDGIIEDDFQLRKEIFFGGLDPKLRKEVWPFLLHHYGFHSTFHGREQIRNDKYIEYQSVRRKRNQMSVEEKDIFWKNIQCTVEKDVVRTDRSNPFFAGDDNPHIEVMKNILLNYAVYNPSMGYTQGMSDLLAPVLAEIQDEAETFWCFVGLMQRTIFVTSPKDADMDTNLNYLRELFRLVTPKFFNHLKAADSLELLFVHRWILLCFKREFSEQEAMRMWEACWSHFQTDYFHLFLCTAIVAIYGEDIIAQCLRPDEMLVHFSSLAMHMNGELVLRKARGLLHQFRLFPRIPCSLSKLCELCGPGMWDSGHVPIIDCLGNHGGHSCPYGGQDPTGHAI